jgi:transcriptional regulator with XRE-family HTH domain
MDSGKVGGFISALRRESGMTQQDLANRLNVTNKAVSKWETGEGYPEITMLPALADALGVSVDELLRGARSGPAKAEDGAARGGNSEASGRLEQARLKFRNMSLISAGISVMGLIAFYVITLASWYELIGFGVMAAFLTCSILLFVTQYNSLKAVEARGTPGALAGGALIVQVCFWAAALIAALPYLMFDNGMYPQSVLQFHYYIRMLPAFLIAGGALVCLACQLLIDRLNIRSAMPGLRFESAALREGKLRLNLGSFIYCAAFAFLVCVLQALEYPAGAGAAIVLSCLLIYIACAALYIAKNRGKPETGILAVCVLRNLLCLYLISTGMASGAYGAVMDFEWDLAGQVRFSIVIPYIYAAFGVFIVFTAIVWLIEYQKSKRLPA